MRRREVLAGLGSVGVVAGAGAVAAFGVPSFDDDSDGSSGLVGRQHEPYEIETVDAPEAKPALSPSPRRINRRSSTSSRRGVTPVSNRWTPSPRPTTESATTSSFCPSRANRSATRFPGGARRVVGRKRRRLDDRPRPDLGAHQPILGIALSVRRGDRRLGTVRWHDSGIKTADELVAGIERALEGGAE